MELSKLKDFHVNSSSILMIVMKVLKNKGDGYSVPPHLEINNSAITHTMGYIVAYYCRKTAIIASLACIATFRPQASKLHHFYDGISP